MSDTVHQCLETVPYKYEPPGNLGDIYVTQLSPVYILGDIPNIICP